jgi:hypothetical protein
MTTTCGDDFAPEDGTIDVCITVFQSDGTRKNEDSRRLENASIGPKL